MKKMYIVSLSVAVLMLSGCVVTGNGGGEKLTDEQKAGIEDALNEARDAVNEAGEEVGDILDMAMEKADEEMEDVDWAREYFDDYDEEKDKKMIIVRDSDGEALEDTEAFIDSLGLDSWEKIDTMPDGLEAEEEYIIKQQGTETVFGNNEEKYYEIGRMTVYEGGYVKFEALSSEDVRWLLDMVSEDWLTAVYKM